MFHNVLTFILLFNLARANYTALVDNSKDDYVFPTKCIEIITSHHFPCDTRISVVYTNTDDTDIGHLLKSLNTLTCYSIILNTFNNKDESQYEGTSDLYILIAEDISELTTWLAKLVQGTLWNAGARYIINIYRIVNVEDIFKILMKYNIINVIVLSKSDNSDDIYTFYPFTNGSCGQNVDAVKLRSCEDIYDISTGLTDNVPNDFRNCTIRTLMKEEPPYVILDSSNLTFQDKPLLGLEQYILNTISEIEGIKIDYTYKGSQNFAIELDNGTTKGMLTFLQNGEIDILGGGFLFFRSLAIHFDYIFGYMSSDLLILSAIERDAVWQTVYKEFSLALWMTIISFNLLFIVVFFVFLKVSQQNKTDRISLIIKLWGYFYTNTSQKLSRNKNLRPIMISWIWFSFFISSFYITGFFSLMAKLGHNNIRYDIKPIIQRNLTPCVNDYVRALFKFYVNVNIPENKEINCSTTTQALDAVSSRSDIMTIETKGAYNTIAARYVDDEGYHKLYEWRLPRVQNMACMYVSKGYPLKGIIQKRITQMLESGLIQGQENRINTQRQKAVIAKEGKLKLRDTSGIRAAFGILIAGLSLSTVCFIIEIYSKCPYNNKMAPMTL